jgi:hypothetical protein
MAAVLGYAPLPSAVNAMVAQTIEAIE